MGGRYRIPAPASPWAVDTLRRGSGHASANGERQAVPALLATGGRRGLHSADAEAESRAANIQHR